jgi:ParB-like chromosome segregation protein Spo0J
MEMAESAIETPDEKLPVEWVPREDALPNDWNPNRMGAEKQEELVQSILDHGWTQPIVVKSDTDEIVDGEQRWHASGDSRIRENEKLTPDGIPAGHIPVFRLGVDDTQARVATMQHNVNGDMNSDDLGEIFADLDDSGMFYDVSDRLAIGETGIDRLIERARSEEEVPEAFTEEPDDEEASEEEAFTEAIEFQMTLAEYEQLQTVIENISVIRLCAWAIKNNVHSQTRVDMRTLSDRDKAYQEGEDLIEYPDVDIETRLRSFYRDDDPEEVTDE